MLPTRRHQRRAPLENRAVVIDHLDLGYLAGGDGIPEDLVPLEGDVEQRLGDVIPLPRRQPGVVAARGELRDEQLLLLDRQAGDGAADFGAPQVRAALVDGGGSPRRAPDPANAFGRGRRRSAGLGGVTTWKRQAF